MKLGYLPPRSVRLKAIGFVMLALAAPCCGGSTHERSQRRPLARAHGAGVLETHRPGGAALTASWAAAGRDRLWSLLHPIQGSVRGLPMDAVWLVEAIVVVPAFLGGLALWLSTRQKG
jgi:hypothetical protein